MIWLILAVVGAGSFFVTGFNLLTDPLCISADFGGGRVVQVTCRSDEFGTVTGTQAGLISILIGLGILGLLFWRPIKAIYLKNKYMKTIADQTVSDFSYIENKVTTNEFVTNVAETSDKKCPKCAEYIKVEAVKCRFCGSDLGPKGIEKTNFLLNSFLKKYSLKNHAFEIMALTLVLVAAIILISTYTTKTREINALKESGQICVYNQDKSLNFGCADYPQIKFEICSTYEIVSWYAWMPEYDSLTDDYSRSQGRRDFNCSSEFPYLYSIDVVADASLRLGEYDVDGTPYSLLTGGTYLDGGHDLTAEVSLKK